MWVCAPANLTYPPIWEAKQSQWLHQIICLGHGKLTFSLGKFQNRGPCVTAVNGHFLAIFQFGDPMSKHWKIRDLKSGTCKRSLISGTLRSFWVRDLVLGDRMSQGPCVTGDLAFGEKSFGGAGSLYQNFTGCVSSGAFFHILFPNLYQSDMRSTFSLMSVELFSDKNRRMLIGLSWAFCASLLQLFGVTEARQVYSA